MLLADSSGVTVVDTGAGTLNLLFYRVETVEWDAEQTVQER